MSSATPPDDDDPFGVIELLRKRSPDLAARLARMRRQGPTPQSTRAPAPAPARVSASEHAITQLPFLENVYFLSRLTPATHRVRVTYRQSGADHIAVCSWTPASSAATLGSCLGRGPCCASHDILLGEADSGVAGDEREAAVAAAVTAVRKRSPECTISQAIYLGFYGEATVTELISRTPSGTSAEGHLRIELEDRRAELAAPPASSSTQRDLERLDLECMLSILNSPSARHAPGQAGSSEPARPAGDSLLFVASASLFYDKHGDLLAVAPSAPVDCISVPTVTPQPLPPDLLGLVRTVSSATASLRAMDLREGAHWLPFQRASPGPLLLLQLARLGGGGASGAGGATSLIAEARRLIESAGAVRAAALGRTLMGGAETQALSRPSPWAVPGWQLLPADLPAASSRAGCSSSLAAATRSVTDVRCLEIRWRPRLLRRPHSSTAGAAAVAAVGSSGSTDTLELDMAAVGAAVEGGASEVDLATLRPRGLHLKYVLRCLPAKQGAGGAPQFSLKLCAFHDEEGGDAEACAASLQSHLLCPLRRVAQATGSAESSSPPADASWFCPAASVLAPGLTMVVQGARPRSSDPGVGDQRPIDIVVDLRQAAHF